MTTPITRRDAILTGLGAAAAAAVLPTRAAGSALNRWLRDEPQHFFPWTDLGDGAWAVVDPQSGGNCLLAVGKGQSVLVDTKFPALGRALLREAEAVGSDLRYAVNTHHHGDHTGGNVAFIAEGVEVVAHPKAEPRILANFEQYVGQVGGGPRMVAGMDRPGKDQALEEAGQLTVDLRTLDGSDWAPTLLMTGDEMELEYGGRTLQLKHFGRNAHTDNDTIVYLPDADILHTGDLVFAGLHPFFDPSAGVTARGWIAVLEDLHAMCTADTRVVPGHGERGKGDRSLITAQRDYLQRLVDAVQAEIDAGRTSDEAQQKTWDFMEGLGFEQVRPRAIAAVYDELNTDD
jgi:glyoxylase-like metal-dependent hydrolase (beta-lactamase superfamily II)